MASCRSWCPSCAAADGSHQVVSQRGHAWVTPLTGIGEGGVGSRPSTQSPRLGLKRALALPREILGGSLCLSVPRASYLESGGDNGSCC